MIELNRRNDGLVFRFPEVHPQARLSISFRRTLRIPDDDSDYPLPPGLGDFPLVHVDDFAARLTAGQLERGGVLMPMYQSEAMWVSFDGHSVSRRRDYPFLVKIAAGKINAVTGEDWSDGAHRDPQDYVVVPEQPWLDGYCVEKGIIRQFVAAPLGAGYSAEEQLTGEATWGGLQIMACPMKREAFERHYPQAPDDSYGLAAPRECAYAVPAPMETGAMGLAAGGRMRQEIEEDPYDLSDWDLRNTSRCFVHLTNSLVWRKITGSEPPTTPPTAAEYERAGLPWFDYYGDGPALDGGERLKKLKSLAQLGTEDGGAPLPENESVRPSNIVNLRQGLSRTQVREC